MNLGEFRRLTAHVPDECEVVFQPLQPALECGSLTVEVDEDEADDDPVTRWYVSIRGRIELEIQSRDLTLRDEIQRLQEAAQGVTDLFTEVFEEEEN